MNTRLIQLYLLAFSVFTFTISNAQLYMPRDVKAAYTAGSRSSDGRPGKAYWQNRGRYIINVQVNPIDGTVRGTEEIVYINKSPYPLDYLNFRLTQNIHKPGAYRNRSVDSSYLTSGMHIDSFVVNGQSLNWGELPDEGTFRWQNLPKPLAPKDSVRLRFNWHYTLASRGTREGRIDSTSYFIAYFYPRVAVVDDYNWWDWMEFTDVQEFYNDFNDYELNVTVPANYIVWSTGTLQNINDVLQSRYAEKLKASFTSDSIIRIAELNELTSKKVTSQNNTNTWQWKAENVTDVAFGLSDHFVWDASSVVVDPSTKRRVSVQAIYNDTSKLFTNSINASKNGLKWFSSNYPGVPYPFPKFTVSQGYDDMEYPMMANDIETDNVKGGSLVIQHELAHTYFPFYMGINESRYPFMDEGWATALELLVSREKWGKSTADSVFREKRVAGWINDISSTQDLPIIIPADALRGVAYGNNAYGKAALAYHALLDLVGESVFKKCLREFMSRWNGKHPIPWDFFNTFNNVSGKNLDWFWQNWFFSPNYIDLKAVSLTGSNNAYKLEVQNKGGFVIPFTVSISYVDGTKESRPFGTAAWSANQKNILLSLSSKKKIKTLLIETGIFMDAFEEDNAVSAK